MSTAVYDTAANWLIQTETGEVFGPVDFQCLLGWAKEGRVAPGYRLSQDRKVWFAPSAVAELEMEWVVEIPGTGLFGPVHRTVVDELRGIHGAGLRVFGSPGQPKPQAAKPIKSSLSEFEKELSGLGQLLSGEKKQVQIPDARAENERLRQLEAANAAVADLTTKLSERDERLIRQESRIAELEEAVASESAFRAEETKARDALNIECADLKLKLDSARTAASAKDEAIAKSSTRIAELEQKLSAESALRAAIEAGRAEGTQTLDNLNGRIAQLKAELDSARAESDAQRQTVAKNAELVSEQARQIAADRDELMRQEQRIALLEEAIASETAALATERASRTAAETTLAERERELAELRRTLASLESLRRETEASVVRLQQERDELERLVSVERAKSEVVPALNRQIAELGQALASERAAVAEQVRRSNDLQAQLAVANEAAEALRAEKNAAAEQIAVLTGRIADAERILAAEQAAKARAVADFEGRIAELRQSLAAAYASAETARTEKDAAVAGLTREIAALVEKLEEHHRKPKIEVVHEVEVVGRDPKPEAPADKKKSDFVSLETQLMQELNRVQSGKAAGGGARKGFGFFSGKE